MKAVFYLSPVPDWAVQLSGDPWLMTIGGRPLIDHWFYAAWELGARKITVAGEGCTSALRDYLSDADSRWGIELEFDLGPSLAELVSGHHGELLVLDDFNLPWLSQEGVAAPSRPERPVLRWQMVDNTLRARPLDDCQMISLASLGSERMRETAPRR